MTPNPMRAGSNQATGLFSIRLKAHAVSTQAELQPNGLKFAANVPHKESASAAAAGIIT